MDLKKLFSLPASAKYTADENSTTPLRTSTHQRRIECDIECQGACERAGPARLPHVAVPYSRHRYDGPPKSVGDGGEIRIGAIFVSKVNCTGEHDHACEHKAHCARSPGPPGSAAPGAVQYKALPSLNPGNYCYVNYSKLYCLFSLNCIFYRFYLIKNFKYFM